MSGPTKYIAAGVQQAYLGFLDTTAFLTGNSVTAPSNGSGSNMIRLLGVQEAQPGVIESDAENIPGDDGSLGKINFPPEETPEFVITAGAFDLDTNAKLQSTLVEALANGIQLGILQPNDPTNPDCVVILNSKTKKKDVGVDGAKAWSGLIVNLASIEPLSRETFSGRTGAVNRLKVTSNIASKKAWGVTITDAVNGTTGGVYFEFTNDYPISMFRYTGSGSGGQTFLADPIPNSVSDLMIWSNTALLTPTTDYTVNTTTGLVTFVTNPAAGAKVIGLYGIKP